MDAKDHHIEVKPRVSLYIYTGIALLAFAWRFVSIPWDFGGCFFQGWVAIAGAIFFIDLHPRLTKSAQKISWATIMPLVGILLIGTTLFAPQSLLPLMCVGFVLAGALVLWSRSKKPQSGLVLLLLIPLAFYCIYGFRHMADVMKLRSLHPTDIVEMRFVQTSQADGTTVISNVDSIEHIAVSLKGTSPYSPNHEGIRNARRLTIIMRDGSTLDVRIGNGNSAHPSFIWIEFGVEVYQNEHLRDALSRAGINLRKS